MRSYLANHPRRNGTYSPEEVATLAAVCDRLTDLLSITERVDIDLLAARILAVYEGGKRDPGEIVRTIRAEATSIRGKR